MIVKGSYTNRKRPRLAEHETSDESGVGQGRRKGSNKGNLVDRNESRDVSARQKSKAPRRSVTATAENGPKVSVSSAESVVSSETRICMKNIPVHYNDQDVKEYILKQWRDIAPKHCRSARTDGHDDSCIITDCRILRRHRDDRDDGKSGSSDKNVRNYKPPTLGKSRRIAFVGFAKAEHALLCQQKLNRAYCGSARLVVEMALPPQVQNEPTETPFAENRGDGVRCDDGMHDKRNKDDNLDKGDKDESSEDEQGNNNDRVEQKKLEFLSAMGIAVDQTNTKHQAKNVSSSSSRKFWSNDDGGQNEGQIPQESDDDDDHDSSSVSSSSSSSVNDNIVMTPPEEAIRRADGPNGPNSPNGNSDLDFLRSKKVAVVDFLEEEQADHDSDVGSKRISSDCMDKGQEKDNNHDNNKNDDHDHHDDSDSSSYSSSSDDHSASNTTLTNNLAQTTTNEDTRHKPVVESPAVVQTNVASNRIFVRNLPFSTTEDDLRQYFQTSDDTTTTTVTIEECHIPIDDQKRNKGYAFVTFNTAAAASQVIKLCDRRDFQGRILHILPALEKKGTSTTSPQMVGDDFNTTYKERMELKRRQNAMSDSTGWSASYVRGDAVVDNLASRLGLKKGDVMGVKDGLSAGDAAVRLALGETAIIEENRIFFNNHNINMEALVSLHSSDKSDKSLKALKTLNPPNNKDDTRSRTMILVKNLPYDTVKDELLKIFTMAGDPPRRILLPPSRTIAVVEYEHPNDAKKVFKRVAYRRYKNVPLYLEWAPLAAITKSDDVSGVQPTNTEGLAKDKSLALHSDQEKGENAHEDEHETDLQSSTGTIGGITPSLYVKNLNFGTTERQLLEFFSKHYPKDIRAVRIPLKAAPIKQGLATSDKVHVQSMGFGFVEFKSMQSAINALKTLQGITLDGHALELKLSTGSNGSSVPMESKIKDKAKHLPTKLMVRNVPFQASRTELLQLFGSFGQLKNVRMPKKFDGGHRGYAFVEYVTAKEASAAMKTLSRTHLYGRRLVLEWALASDDDYMDNNNVDHT